MSEQRYHAVARYLHWMVAALVVVQFVLAKLAEAAATPLREVMLLANHRSVGITVLLLAALRLAWRLREGAPRPLAMPGWQRTASQVSHRAMYGLIFLLPITGWMLSSAAGDGVSWFSLVPLPGLVAVDAGLADILESVHGALAWLLFLLAAMHTGAALWHSLIRKDSALWRISSAGTTAVFLVIVAAGLVALIPAAAVTDVPPRARATATSDGQAWHIDKDASYVRFAATQAGVEVDGEWLEWDADIRFDEENPDGGRVDATVRSASVATQDDERDQTLRAPEWFDADRYPLVRFRAASFRTLPDGRFAASGRLTVKGRESPVVLAFEVRRAGERRVLHGEMDVDRLTLGLGTGEWTDTRFIGQVVTVVVHIETSS